VEQANNIMVCPDPNRQEVWTEVVDGLADGLCVTKMDPEVAPCICNLLRQHEVESKFRDHADYSIPTEQNII